MTYLEMRGRNRHSSRKLDSLLGKRVKITFIDSIDWDEKIGRLIKSDHSFRYAIATVDGVYNFAKTHVKTVEVIQ